MKSTCTKGFSLTLTFVSLMMVGLLTLTPSQSAVAQSNVVQDFDFVPSGPYVAPNVALIRVENQIEVLKPQFDNLTPHTQDYRNLEAKVDFYLSILKSLEGGETVQASIKTALTVLVSDAHETLPKPLRQEYKDEAIQLLKS